MSYYGNLNRMRFNIVTKILITFPTLSIPVTILPCMALSKKITTDIGHSYFKMWIFVNI